MSLDSFISSVCPWRKDSPSTGRRKKDRERELSDIDNELAIGQQESSLDGSMNRNLRPF